MLRTLRSESQMEAFREFLLLCELEDLGFSGVPLTYDNGELGNNNVCVRLDRVCADEVWCELFSASRVVHLATCCSDHCHIILELVPADGQRQRGAQRYEITWERDPTLQEVIASTWERNTPTGNLGAVASSLKVLMRNLKDWSSKNLAM